MSGELFDNPLGTDGFEFVEFTGPDPERIARQFEAMGFVATARHRSKDVVRYQQGDINFILNRSPVGQPARFRQVHGTFCGGVANVNVFFDDVDGNGLATDTIVCPAGPGQITPIPR